MELVSLFGAFRLLPRQRLLYDGETPVRLGSRAFEILLALVERRGELISKEELISRVWPSTYISSGNLKFQVAGLRRALGDGRDGRRYIETSSGQGYRFVADVTVGNDDAAGPQAPPLAINHNLPVQLTRLIGRADTVARIVEQLPTLRLLTIVGTGGVGKTSVAVAVAEELIPAYEHGVWLIDLASIVNPRLVATALAFALKLEIPSDNPLPGLVAALSGKQMLLVIDNCEHVIEAAAALAVEVLKGSRGVHILATSREPLRVPGEHVYRLLPLAAPAISDGITGVEALQFPAVQLFVERAAANLNDFELSDADAPSACELCRKLDGVPLAIELAAARVGTFGVRGLASRLDDRLRLLTGGRRTALPRHRGIGATLDWSYQLLSQDEQSIFRRLAIFAGGFTEEAARAVIPAADGSPLDVGDILADLVTKSVLTADVGDGDVRFRLFETMRAYAATKLTESGESDTLARRHAIYFRDSLENSAGNRATEDFAAIYAPEIDNIRAALSWAFGPNGDERIAVALAASSAPLWLGHRKRLLELHDAGDTGAPVGAVPVGADPAVAERRQLTIMFCDIVGSTSLSARLDPEDMHLVMRAYQAACSSAVERYDGFVAKFMGDGVLAYFGYPRAHENDAERATRAALEIVEAVGNLETPARETLSVRIGIATGLVVVGYLIGKGAAQEQAVVGDTPNLAARLQRLAEPGDVIVAASTRRLLGALFRLRDLGQQQVKGLVEPIEAWAVEGIASSASRFEAATHGGLTPLVGREQEIGLLLERWALAQDGEGQVVLLSGEPGIGKSRTLSALRERLEVQGAQSLQFQCSPYYVNSALWPSIDNFERALKFGRDERLESKLDKLEALVVGRYGRPLRDVRFIASMLSIPCEERYGPLPMTPQKHKDETLRTLVDLTEAAARSGPSVMLFEDAHWADPTSLEVFELLIDRVRAIPLLIVLTHRPEFQTRWPQHGHVVALNLSKLTRAQSATMVSQVAGANELPPDLLEQILAKTDGVPLFVEELTKSILESDDLSQASNGRECVGTTQIAIPATLRDSLMARLDRFMPVKEVAQIGAAIGREFSYELVAAVTPLSRLQIDDALARLTESGMAFRRGAPPEATYTFKHALVRDAAYDSLLRSRRQELHGRIARVIDERFPSVAQTGPEVLAHHFTQAGQYTSAIPLWQKAGEMALARMALTESISHLNKGLELVSILPLSADRDALELALRVNLGTAWLALGGWPNPEVWNSVHPALPLAKSLRRNDALLPILWDLMMNVMTQGRVADSLQWVNEMLDEAEATGDPDLLIVGHEIAGVAHFFSGRVNEVLREEQQVMALYDDLKHRHLVELLNHDPKTLIGIYAAVSTWMLGYPDRAVRKQEETIAHARRLAHPFDLGFAVYFSTDVFDCRCEPARQHQLAEEVEQIGRDNGMPVLSLMLAGPARGIALVREGNAAEGARALDEALKIWESTGGKLHSSYSHSVRAEGLALSGDLDRALHVIDEQISQVERTGWEERVFYAEMLRLKGWMLSLKGEPESAELYYLASLNWAREQQAKSWELRTSTSLARLWRAQGKSGLAHRLLAPVYDWFTEGFDTKDLRDAKALIEELNGAVVA